MAVLQSATSSGRNFCSVGLTATVNTVVYTAKGYTANVTSDTGATSGTTGTGSATAYIKEIAICNYHASNTGKATILVNGASYMVGVAVSPGDTKVLSGLNTMLNAGATIQAYADIASTLVLHVSGVEVQ